jgi:hypothetical protein
MIVYIAGPITGAQNYKDRFSKAEQRLRAKGHIVLNPAALPIGMPYESYFPICFAMIDAAEKMYFLRGWEKSRGAREEFAYAASKRKMMMFEGGRIMPTYAKDTDVSCARSRADIENTLQRYGAEQFAYATAPGKALIGFTMHDRQVRFILPLPKREEFRQTPAGRDRTPKSQDDAWEQACRQRWRALLLVIKAKLEATECGISTFESEFMANIVLPDNRTVGDFMLPQISAAYDSGKMPAMLPILEG